MHSPHQAVESLKKKKTDLPKEREFCLQLTFGLELQSQLFPRSLVCLTAELELVSLQSHISQNQSLTPHSLNTHICSWFFSFGEL